MLFSCPSSSLWPSCVCVSVCSCCPSGLLSGPVLQCSRVLRREARWNPLPVSGNFCRQVQANKHFRYRATTINMLKQILYMYFELWPVKCYLSKCYRLQLVGNLSFGLSAFKIISTGIGCFWLYLYRKCQYVKLFCGHLCISV